MAPDYPEPITYDAVAPYGTAEGCHELAWPAEEPGKFYLLDAVVKSFLSKPEPEPEPEPDIRFMLLPFNDSVVKRIMDDPYIPPRFFRRAHI